MPTRIETRPSQRGKAPVFNTIKPVAKAKRLPKTSPTLSNAYVSRYSE